MLMSKLRGDAWREDSKREKEGVHGVQLVARHMSVPIHAVQHRVGCWGTYIWNNLQPLAQLLVFNSSEYNH